VLTGVEDIRREVKQLKTSPVQSEIYTKYFSYKENKYKKVNADVFVEEVSKKIKENFEYMLVSQNYKKFKSPFFLKFLSIINEKMRFYELAETLYRTNSLIVDERRAKQVKNFINFFELNKLIESEKNDLIEKITELKERRRSIQLADANEMDIKINKLEKILAIFDERSFIYIAKSLEKIRYTEFLQLFKHYNEKELKDFASFIIIEIYALMKKIPEELVVDDTNI
jgi:hypothetical protein